MTITPIGTAAAGSVTSIHTTATPSTDAKKEMDQEVFLQLLVAQLRNQDPTSPMDTTQMMSQSTELASMEQLSSMADTTRDSFALQMRIAASGLVGQNVSYVDADGVTQTGVARAVSFAGSVPMVTVGETEVPLDAVSAISTPTTPATTPTTPTPPTTTAGTAGATA